MQMAAGQLGEGIAMRNFFQLSEHRESILDRPILPELEFAFDAIDRHLESDNRLEQFRFELRRQRARPPWTG